MTTRPDRQRVCIARIGAAHGVRGEVRLWSFTTEPAAVLDYGPLETENGRKLEVETLRPGKDFFVARLKGVVDRHAAEELRNAELYVPRDRLPDPEVAGEFYHADLMGLTVVDEQGLELGTVIAVQNFGAGDLIEVRPAGGGETVMLPFTEATVPKIDIAAGRIVTHRADGDICLPVGRDGRRIGQTMWRASVLTIFPEMFPGPLGASLAGKALEKGLWALDPVDIRDFARDRHRTVDDTPAGGGPGMVMKADVLAAAIDGVAGDDGRPRLLMSARGVPLNQAYVADLARGSGVVIVCGRFEGVDERVIAGRKLEEVSIGDYVLSGGELAAMVAIDACVRLLPGVMGAAASAAEESFAEGLLEYPQYTRPQSWDGHEIPEVLASGHHGKIAAWRRAEAERLTRERRPDLWAVHLAKTEKAKKKPPNG